MSSSASEKAEKIEVRAGPRSGSLLASHTVLLRLQRKLVIPEQDPWDPPCAGIVMCIIPVGIVLCGGNKAFLEGKDEGVLWFLQQICWTGLGAA